MNSEQTISILESGRRLDELIVKYKQSKSYQENKEIKSKVTEVYNKYKHNMKSFVETIGKINSDQIKLTRPQLTIEQLENMVEQLAPDMDSLDTVIKIYNNLHTLQTDTPTSEKFFDDGDDLLFE